MKFLLLIYFLVGPSGAIDYPQFDDSILFSMNWIKHEEIPMDLSLVSGDEVGIGVYLFQYSIHTLI